MAESIIIDFQVDSSGLEPAIDLLEKTSQIDKAAADQFKKTNAELQKRQQVMATTGKVSQQSATQTKKSIDDLDKAVNKLTQDFIDGFQEGVQEELKKAGVSAEEFEAALKGANEEGIKSTVSLRQQLREMTQQLAEMKVRGEDNTEQYQQLAREAGQLQDAIGDAAQEVRNFASDTSTLDGVIGIAQGLAGGFAVAQGAAALFGDESEELQEVLLRVNAAMAVLQGLQQVSTVLKKESAAATFLEVTAQKLYNLVIGESTGLLAAFRVALAATGVGLFILGITALVQILLSASKATKALIGDFQRFNLEVERDLQNLSDNIDVIKRASEERQAALKAQGVIQSEITKEAIRGLTEELQGVIELQNAMRDRANQARVILTQMATGEADFNEVLADEASKTVNTFKELGSRRADLAKQVRIQSIENERQIQREQLEAVESGLNAQLALVQKNSKKDFDLQRQIARAKAAIELNEAGQNLQKRKEIEANLQRELRSIDLNFLRIQQEDRIAGLEATLLKAQQKSREINVRTSQEEIDLQKRVIQEKARLDLMQEGLTANQRIAIQVRAFSEIANLQREFNQQSSRESLEDFISANNIQLQQLNITNDERLRLTEENIIAQAEIEIQANQGLSDKIKEIAAKRDADIRATRLQSIQQTLQYELDLETARTGVLRRANDRIASSERRTLSQRIAAINQLAALDIAVINAKQDALEKQLEQALISQKDYNLQYAQLKDEEARITEDTELKKRTLYKQTEQQRISNAIEVTSRLLDIIQQFGDNAAEREQIRIDNQRQQIEALREAGAITEKEAERRQKQLEIEERKAKTQQAKRERDIAVFRALLAIPQAFLQGLSQGSPVLAAIYAALAAVQAGIIASKPIPKFGKGKKNTYEGLAEIGETGAELVESNGQMYVAPKRTIVWLGKKDKVFNPQETMAMLDKRGIRATSIDKYRLSEVAGYNINYDKLGKIIGKEVGKNIPQVGFSFDDSGFTSYVQGQTSFTKYLNQRRSY